MQADNARELRSEYGMVVDHFVADVQIVRQNAIACLQRRKGNQLVG